MTNTICKVEKTATVRHWKIQDLARLNRMSIKGHVYHEWPVLNWYQFELSFLFSCKLLIFTPLIKSTMRWCEYESVYKGIVLSFSLGLTWRNLSIHCYKWGTYLSRPLIDILLNLARSCIFQCRTVAVFSTLHIVFVIFYPIMSVKIYSKFDVRKHKLSLNHKKIKAIYRKIMLK
jgi:hypothetical protein